MSNRADLISDGDALVEVRVPQNVPMEKVTLTLNGANVDAAFVADADARTLRGVLSGLVVGENVFVANSNGNGAGRPWAALTITNHARGGRFCSARKPRYGSAQRRPPCRNRAIHPRRTQVD